MVLERVTEEPESVDSLWRKVGLHLEWPSSILFLGDGFNGSVREKAWMKNDIG
jgi:hypothetical protein